MGNVRAGIVLGFLTLSACGGGIVKDVPQTPSTAGKFIFYLHGSVEESEGETAKYKRAVGAIAASSATVISERRGHTDPNSYAEKVNRQVSSLIKSGVPARNISVTGFSKGAIIALAAAGRIDNPEVNYVLLAGCSEYLNQKYGVDSRKAAGRILSIYDSGDEKFESCVGIVKPGDKVKFQEIVLDSGKGHKLFRIPKEKFIEQWRDPLVEWAGA